MEKDAIVIIPTYNEAENIRDIVQRTLAASQLVEVLIVDDNSPDGTGQLADELAENERVHVLHRLGKSGLGVAYLAGFEWAMAQGYQRFFEMDADGSHPPERLPAMLALLGASHDVVVGSRWMPGGRVVNWPWQREVLSRGGNLYTRLLLGIEVKDATGGFRGFTRAALHRINLDQVASQGYCFQVDLLWRGLQANLDIIEIPIVFTERVRGESKMSSAIVVEALLQVTGWGIRRVVRELLHR